MSRRLRRLCVFDLYVYPVRQQAGMFLSGIAAFQLIILLALKLAVMPLFRLVHLAVTILYESVNIRYTAVCHSRTYAE